MYNFSSGLLAMAIAYSQNIRIRALELIGNGVSVSQVSRAFKISRPTLYRWKEQLDKTGSTVPLKGKPPAQNCVIKDWNKFKNFVDANPDKTQKELAQLWGNVSHHTISRGFKKIGYTRKKNLWLSRKMRRGTVRV
jgi:transposase